VRECGECSLCCKLLGVTELGKAGGKWCSHAVVPGGGCRVYEGRPHSCRAFQCGWLASEVYPDHWKPTRCKMVIGFNADGDHVLQIYVDPSNRNGWQKEPWKSDIERLAKGKYRTEIRLFEPGAVIEVKHG
jgi:hypothetical protein